MPSPFPGMDPYLERASLWPDVHQRLIVYAAEALQPKLRPRYLARIGERVEVAGFGSDYIPDVLIVHPPPPPLVTQGPTGVLVADDPLTLSALDEERRVPFIEIIYQGTGAVVTMIEVLSPSNKTSKGSRSYLQKQEDLLASAVNLVEIDLLSSERVTTLARKADVPQAPDGRYLVCISRGHRREALEVYPISLKSRLPRCRIPLRPEDEDVALDLSAVFTRCYDVGGYDLLIDYTKPPPVMLYLEEMDWLRAHLEKWQAQAQ